MIKYYGKEFSKLRTTIDLTCYTHENLTVELTSTVTLTYTNKNVLLDYQIIPVVMSMQSLPVWVMFDKQ